MMFAQACQRAGKLSGLNLLAWEEETGTDLKAALSELESMPEQVSLFIGSEGGFSLDEARLAHGYGIVAVSLGKRILRAETAGLVTASAVFYQFDQLK